MENETERDVEPKCTCSEYVKSSIRKGLHSNECPCPDELLEKYTENKNPPYPHAGQVSKIGDSKDPRKDRSTAMRCQTCMWFCRKEPKEDASTPGAAVGRCRRHSPIMSGYPVVFVNGWCGDHEMNENALG